LPPQRKEKDLLPAREKIGICLLKGELNNIPPLQGEGLGGGGVNEMSILGSIIRVEKNL